MFLYGKLSWALGDQLHHHIIINFYLDPYLDKFCAGCNVLPDRHPVLLLVEHRRVVVHVHQVYHHLGVIII